MKAGCSASDWFDKFDNCCKYWRQILVTITIDKYFWQLIWKLWQTVLTDEVRELFHLKLTLAAATSEWIPAFTTHHTKSSEKSSVLCKELQCKMVINSLRLLINWGNEQDAKLSPLFIINEVLSNHPNILTKISKLDEA